VFTLRCTQRLLKRLKVKPETAAPIPTTRLGDWYANLLHVERQQVVLAVSERTFLPIVVAAAPGTGLVQRVRAATRDLLRALGIAPDDIATEDAAMGEVTTGKSMNRQVLGIMTDFARALPYYLDEGATLLEVSLKLARTPCSPLFKTTVSPDRTTLALFGVKAA
jgi:hypothetical protein